MFNISNAIISEKLPEPLEKKELYRLLKLLKDGNDTVKNQIIEHNLKLVLYVVNTRFSNLNYEKEDIVSIGVIGLIKAINSYDIDRDTEFSTYATKCISTEILIFLREQKKQINTVSLSKPMWVSEENDITFEDIVSQNDELSERINNMELQEILFRSINKLPERHIKIISLYFGFYDGKRYTQKEIAGALNVTHQFISLVIQNSIKKIRKDLIDNGIITKDDIHYEARFIGNSKSIYNSFSKYPKDQIDDSLDKLSRLEKYLLFLKYTETEAAFKLTEEQDNYVTLRIIPKMKRALKKPDIKPLLKNINLESTPIEINKDYDMGSNNKISKYSDEILDLGISNDFIEMTNFSSFNSAMVTVLKLGYINNLNFSNEEIASALNIREEDIDTILQDVIDKAKNRVVVASDVVVKYLKK